MVDGARYCKQKHVMDFDYRIELWKDKIVTTKKIIKIKIKKLRKAQKIKNKKLKPDVVRLRPNESRIKIKLFRRRGGISPGSAEAGPLVCQKWGIIGRATMRQQLKAIGSFKRSKLYPDTGPWLEL